MPTTPNVMSVNESGLALGEIAASMYAFVSASMFRPKQIKRLVFSLFYEKTVKVGMGNF
jgi:hypothetical protein